MSAPAKVNGRFRWELAKGCTDKRRFPDEPTVRAAAQIECEHGSTNRKGEMWVYPCETCRGWHLTNKPSGAKRKVTLEHLYPPRTLELDDGVSTPQFGGYWGEQNQ